MNGKTARRPHTARWLVLPLAACAWSGPIPAAEYPSRPVRLVVPFPPGGVGDFQGRALGPKLGEQLRQQIVIDNRGGANGAVAHEIVAKAAADGYTLLLGYMSALTMNPVLYSKLSYDPVKDFAAISLIGRTTLTLVAVPSFPANSLKELIALAKTAPGKIAYASTGVGNGTHLAVEMLQSAAAIKLVHVPYKGAGPAMIDLLGGHVAFAFVSVAGALPHVRSGRLKALVMTNSRREAVMPDIPTVSEAGFPELEIVNGWWGILAPAHTQTAVISRLNEEIVKVMRTPDIQGRFAAQGVESATSTADQFSSLIKSDLDRWTKVIKQAGIRAE